MKIDRLYLGLAANVFCRCLTGSNVQVPLSSSSARSRVVWWQVYRTKAYSGSCHLLTSRLPRQHLYIIFGARALHQLDIYA